MKRVSMTDLDKTPKKSKEKKDFEMLIARQAERKKRIRRNKKYSAWFGLGMFGLIGWSIAVPTLLGIAVGIWLDAQAPVGTYSWTLTFLMVGLILGCLNAWYWIKKERGE